MFNSIVVAFDGSSHASRALDIGADLAREQGASLGIIYVIDKSVLHLPDEIRRAGEAEHVIDPRPRATIDFGSAPVAMTSSMSQAGSDSLAAMIQYADWLMEHAGDCARRDGASNVETRVSEGDPAEEVVAYARHRNADLIVCGSRGMGRLKSALLGSTSGKIIHLAECSCLTVK